MTSILVTGATGHLGRLAIDALLARGVASADIAALVRDRGRAGDLAERGIDVRVGSFEDPASLDAALARALAWRPRLDVLAHVAGLGLRRRAEDTSLDDWQRVLEVNLRAPFLLTRAAIDPLVASGGAVVAVSSLAGLAGWPYSAAYAASKGGLVTMMRSLALELGPRGVRVNLVCPGGIDSPMLDDLDEITDPDPASAKRGIGLDGTLATPAEVAAAICFLASPEASHVNGTTLTVDGGATA
jgi:NAD(P)-dependent dehydrogenase (short-subunit alcohol dehydrogenase family)